MAHARGLGRIGLQLKLLFNLLRRIAFLFSRSNATTGIEVRSNSPDKARNERSSAAAMLIGRWIPSD